MRRSARRRPAPLAGERGAAERSQACRPVASASPITSTAPAELLRRLRQVARGREDDGPAARRRPAAGDARRALAPVGRLRRGRSRAPRRPSGCSAPTAWPSSRPSCPRFENAVETCAGGARRRACARWSNAATAAEEARHAALAAERDAREAPRARSMPRPRRSSGSRRSARALASARATSSPCSRLRREAVSCGRAVARCACPILARSSMTSKTREAVAATAASAVADKRAEAATKARETAADRERLERRGARAGRMAQARRPTPSSGSPGDRAAEAAGGRARRAGEGAGRARRADRASSSVPTTRARSGSARPPPPSARPRKPVVDAARRQSPRRTSDRPMRASAAPPRRRAPRRSRRAAPNSRMPAVEKFECVPQRLPEKLGFDPERTARSPTRKRRRSNG